MTKPRFPGAKGATAALNVHREGYRDVYCQVTLADGTVCNFGPRVRLEMHVRIAHPEISLDEYRRQFGRYSLVSRTFRLGRSDIWLDRVEDGRITIKAKTEVCSNGHKRTAKNTYTALEKAHPDSLDPDKLYLRQRCRICDRKTPPGPRNCLWCERSFTPHHMRPDAIYCSVPCNVAAQNHKRSVAKSLARSKLKKLKCPTCGEWFQPNQAKQRFCSLYCQERRRPKVTPHSCRCETCRRWFKTNRPTQRFCSVPCRTKAKRERRKT